MSINPDSTSYFVRPSVIIINFSVSQAVEGGRFVAEVGGGGGGRLKAVVGEDPLDLGRRVVKVSILAE